MPRCFDCFHEFGATEDRFAVLKQMRELPAEMDPAEKALMWGSQFDQVFVCVDCAGWYGDHQIPVTAVEADPDFGLVEAPAAVQAAAGPTADGKSAAVVPVAPSGGDTGRLNSEGEGRIRSAEPRTPA